jgi:NAD(P)-dependent dehydrogenase (short-subunit alcohol dehydrogenase family)
MEIQIGEKIDDGKAKGRGRADIGAASGIGAACAMAFASKGAKVVLGDIDATCGERIAQEIDDGRRAVALFQHLHTAQSKSSAQASGAVYGSTTARACGCAPVGRTMFGVATLSRLAPMTGENCVSCV